MTDVTLVLTPLTSCFCYFSIQLLRLLVVWSGYIFFFHFHTSSQTPRLNKQVFVVNGPCGMFYTSCKNSSKPYKDANKSLLSFTDIFDSSRNWITFFHYASMRGKNVKWDVTTCVQQNSLFLLNCCTTALWCCFDWL